MADLHGLRFVRPADVETQVFDLGTIKWMSEPRVTDTTRFTMGVVLLQPGKGHAHRETRRVRDPRLAHPLNRAPVEHLSLHIGRPDESESMKVCHKSS